MKKRIVLIAASIFGFSLLFNSCSKKESGICYCSFYSGDRTHYDLRDLPKQQQIDSCNHLSELASNFAGSCKLKK